MSDNTYIFNANSWVKNSVTSLSDDVIKELDARYINVGENVIDQNITNLNLVDLNISSNGYIYFGKDSTTQTTAYDPNVVTNKINSFLSSNNNFTGSDTFTNLSVVDSSNNSTQLQQYNTSNFNIKNQVPNGKINL